jgi:aspartyl-tRNA synthetase
MTAAFFFSPRVSLDSHRRTQIAGTVRARPANQVNSAMPTGAVEVLVQRVEVLARSAATPFPVSLSDEQQQVNDEVMLRHRYLQLRRPSLQGAPVVVVGFFFFFLRNACARAHARMHAYV